MIKVDHWKFFKEFCKYETMSGGPDPHMKAVVELSRDSSYEEKVWRSLLYVGFYNVPSAEVVWSHYSDVSKLKLSWLNKHWKGFRTRRERRTVKSPQRMMEYIGNYDSMLSNVSKLNSADFGDVWEYALSLRHVGRYAATKLAEIWNRLGLIEAEVLDIRAKGGWSPREGLALISGDHSLSAKDDSVYAVGQVEAQAAKFKYRLEKSGIDISWFEYEVMLCEYKSSYSSGRQYPGRSLDSELSYEKAIHNYWYDENFITSHMEVRKRLSPGWALGEVRGWDGVRKELGRVVSTYGYTWSDKLYDYNETVDLARPVVYDKAN